jgi:hypothetical protein
MLLVPTPVFFMYGSCTLHSMVLMAGVLEMSQSVFCSVLYVGACMSAFKLE